MERSQKTPGKRLRKRVSGLFPSWLWAAGMGAVVAAALFARPGVRSASAVQTAAGVDERWEQMVSSLTEHASRFDGDVGIFIKDLSTGRTFEHKADRRFLSASLIKVPIMAALFAEVEAGRIRLDGSVEYRRKHRREGAGIIKWERPGKRFTVSSLVHTMISKSDNTATAMVIDLMGYDRLNSWFRGFGLTETRIAPTGMSLASRLDPSLDNWTTPAEMGRLLEKIYRHDILRNDGLSDLMLEIMKGANSRSRLARDLPSQWQLARKTGLLRKNCHDVGIVFTPEGDYLICVLTGDNRTYAGAKGFISEVGRQTYAYYTPNS